MFNMKPETKAKLQRGWYNFTVGVKELWPWWITGLSVGTYIGCCKAANNAGKRLNGLEATQAVIIEKHNLLCDQVNQHADVGNRLVDRVKDLERQNALLLEQALKETKGDKGEGEGK